MQLSGENAYLTNEPCFLESDDPISNSKNCFSVVCIMPERKHFSRSQSTTDKENKDNKVGSIILKFLFPYSCLSRNFRKDQRNIQNSFRCSKQKTPLSKTDAFILKFFVFTFIRANHLNEVLDTLTSTFNLTPKLTFTASDASLI